MAFVRCEPDDPERCQASGKYGQCPYTSCDGSQYCPRHGGNKEPQAQQQQEANMYRIKRYETRLQELSSSPKIKSLREEIALMRALLEELFGRIRSDNEILIYQQRIADMIMKIQQLVTACMKLELKIGDTLDKNQLIKYTESIIEILSTHITDPTILDNIIEDLHEL